MDGALILEFETYQEASLCLDAIHTEMLTLMDAMGYRVLDVDGSKHLVGKNAQTGENILDGARTIIWDEIAQSPDGTFYFASPRNDPRFAHGVNMISGFSFIEKMRPREWAEQDAQETPGFFKRLVSRIASINPFGVFPWSGG